MQRLVAEINAQSEAEETNVYDVALGFIKVANETMSRPIRALTQNRGFNPRNHILDVFGGAGAQHACAIARGLGISTVFVHKHCGILSAYGLGLADVVQEKEEPLKEKLQDGVFEAMVAWRFCKMQEENEANIMAVGFEKSQVESKFYLNLRYVGTNTSIMIEKPQSEADGPSLETLFAQSFERQHRVEFGFNFEARDILIDNVRVRSVGKKQTIILEPISEMLQSEGLPEPLEMAEVYFEVGGKASFYETKVFDLEDLKANMRIEGPAIILNKTSTILVEPLCEALVDSYGNVEMRVEISGGCADYSQYQSVEEVPCDPIELSIFSHRFMSIAEQMGTAL